MTEIIEGSFHPYPVGAHVWQCSTCGNPFCWTDDSSAWGNVEYAFAVFCSQECREQFKLPKRGKKTPVNPIGVIGKNRIPRMF